MLRPGRPVFSSGGPCILIAREALEDIRLPNGDYFDSRFWCLAEDIDLWLRLMLRGWNVVLAGGCRCWHRNSVSFGGTRRLWNKSPALQLVAFRNKYLVVSGTLPLLTAASFFPFFCLSDLAITALSSCHDRKAFTASTLAKWDALRMTSHVWKKRRWILGRRRVSAWAFTWRLWKDIGSWFACEFLHRRGPQPHAPGSVVPGD